MSISSGYMQLLIYSTHFLLFTFVCSFVFPAENATYYQVLLVARNHWGGLKDTQELGLPDLHGVKDSSSLIMAHGDFFSAFWFHKQTCLFKCSRRQAVSGRSWSKLAGKIKKMNLTQMWDGLWQNGWWDQSMAGISHPQRSPRCCPMGSSWSSGISCDGKNPKESTSWTPPVSSKLDDSASSWPRVLSSFLTFFLPHPPVEKSYGKRWLHILLGHSKIRSASLT